ncbi:MAG TPA: CHAD domain-containing protein [Baekduia sp.]|uniref:CHAD domain-containing protein n=1 Tax=Baekduia sp. TaxID=2600305 RepID=UPI002B645F2C|nr:CHAD domain-containing protein [Baekduia sp.]HMJ33651.1 CHAD domain-containing protein [Baekduia sp.]
MAKARDIPGIDGRMTFREAGREAVAVRAREVFEHAGGVLDTDDIERVHDMRVATRRLRAVLEVFEAAFDRAEHRAVLRDVKRLADALGARRDPDVQLAALEALARSMPEEDQPGLDVFAQRIRVDQAQGNLTLAAALQATKEHDLAGRVRALVAAPADADPERAA